MVRALVMDAPARTLALTPIGVVHSPFRERVEAPRQPRAAEALEGGAQGTVELFGGRGYEDALSDLSSWDYVWLVVWFDRNLGFRPKVAPPRSEQKRGLFATRAPYRPNPIGISAVRLLAVEGLCLTVRGLDLLDGTPLLDLKPYVPYTDAIPEANHGWLESAATSGTRPADPIVRYAVAFEPMVAAQLAFLREQHGLDLDARVAEQLALGPTPHAYRRIRRDGDRLRVAVKDWRFWFRIEGRQVTVERMGSGYKSRELAEAPEAHRSFVARWPEPRERG